MGLKSVSRLPTRRLLSTPDRIKRSRPASASLTGTASDDGSPAGSKLTTAWSKVSGPGTVTFGDASALTTTASFSVDGTYVLGLTASDDQLSSSDEVTITVRAASTSNQPPSVNAGPDQTITLPDSATLNGTASDDGLPAGSKLTTAWSKVSGPGTVAFADASAQSTTASFSAAGSYLLRLTASDSALSSSDDIAITVNTAGGPPPGQPSGRASSIPRGRSIGQPPTRAWSAASRHAPRFV